MIAEAYPALWSHGFARQDRTGDQHDAFSIAAWLSRADRDGSLAAVLKPGLSPLERTIAQVEGWILGVEANGSPKGGSKPKTGRQPIPGRKNQAPTTVPGHINKNGQTVLRSTGLPGNDHNQRVYILSCGKCGHAYGANGSDIWLRRCPACQGGAPGLDFEGA